MEQSVQQTGHNQTSKNNTEVISGESLITKQTQQANTLTALFE